MWQLLLLLSLTSAAPTFEAQTLDDRIVSGSIVELTPDRLVVASADGNVSLEMNKLLKLSLKQKASSPSPAPSSMVLVELTDGSTIAARQYTVSGDQASITLLNDEVLQTPTRTIRNVRLQTELESVAGQFSKILAKKFDADLLVVLKGDNLDYHQGVLSDINAETVQFKLDGEILPIKRAKVYGLSYRHLSSETPSTPLFTVIDQFGSHWQASKISLNNKMQLTTPTGITYSCLQENISQIDFSMGKVIYLSDLKPESVVWEPFFSTAKKLPSIDRLSAPRNDRNFDSNPLQLAGTEYEKGLAIRSRTEMSYSLPGSFSRFKAIAGIDDFVRPQGRVRLLIRGDNAVLLDVPISGADAPKTIDLDLAGVRKLTILVDFGNTVGFGDHLDLCNARITK